MKRKTLIFYIILILITIKLPATFLMNEKFISNYNNGIYRESEIKKFFYFNFIESYIAFYNYGNILYKNNNFDKAITEYKKALKRFPPKEKECSIRINLALAMLAKIDENDSKDNKIKSLQDTRKELCDDTCENEKVQQLKLEIDEMIKKLNENTQSEGQEQEDDEEQDEEQEEKNTDEIQEELEKIQKDAKQARDENLDYINSSVGQDYYNGKRW